MFKIRSINELTKLHNNPRVINKEDFAKLCISIHDNPDYFSARPLILSDRTGDLVIIAGNQRYEAAKHLGMKEVPTYLLTGLAEDREKEIIVRDNVSNGNWDYDILANEFDAEILIDWGLDLPVDFSNVESEDMKVIEKLMAPTVFGLTIETEIKNNFEQIKKELDRLKIGYVEWEK